MRSQVLSFVLPAAVFDLCQWARLFMQQFFPLHISPASQRDEAHFAVTEPSWCLPERGKIQHEIFPFATMPCSYTDLSVLCSVLYLAHPSYITALSTRCSLKCRCQSLSGRASLSQLSKEPEVENSQADKCDKSWSPLTFHVSQSPTSVFCCLPKDAGLWAPYGQN